MKQPAVSLLGLIALLQVTGCVVIPPPPLDAQAVPEEAEEPELVVHTREQVRETLGHPYVTIMGRYEIFDVSEESINSLFVSIGLEGDFVPDPIDEQTYRVLAEFGPDGVLSDLRWEGADEAPSEEPLPSVNWSDSIYWSYDWLYGAVTASPDGHLLAQSFEYYAPLGTPAIVLHDALTGAPIKQIDAISGCQLLGFDPGDSELELKLERQRWIWWTVPVVTVFLSDSSHLASVTEGDTLCIWNADSLLPIYELSAGEGVWGLFSARSAPIVAAVDGKDNVRFSNALKGFEINTITTCRPENHCTNLKMALSEDGQVLATLQSRWAPVRRAGMLWRYDSLGYSVRLWDVGTGTELAAFDLTHAPDFTPYQSTETAHQIALSPDLGRVALHLGKHIEIWRVNKKQRPAWQEGEFPKTNAWDAELERVLLLPPRDEAKPHHSVAFSADGRKLAAGYSSAIVWEVGTWQEKWRAPSADFYQRSFNRGFIFTADGRRILSGCCSWEIPELDQSPHSADPYK